MFIAEHKDVIETVIKYLSQIIKLKSFFKDSKSKGSITKSGDNVIIKIKGNNITIAQDAFKIFTHSPVLNNSLLNTGKILDSTDEIKSFTIKQSGRKERITALKQKDFKLLTSPNPYLNPKTTEETFHNQILFIKKPNLFPEKGKNWFGEFIYHGRDIKARIDDKSFRKQIDDGFKVGKGDRLKATIIVYMKFDKRLNTFIESNKFSINNITDIIPRSKQTEFDF